MQNLDKVEININKGTKTKLQDFVTMIQSFQVLNDNFDVFQITEHVSKKSGLLAELKKDGTPEGIARIENIEELLNGMRDFVEEQKEIADTTGSLAEFMEDVALATDLDKETNDEDKVALMTVHLAKGLEFPYVFIVGMEEELFPSGMSMNTRSELEEERRLFYVAVTRAEKQAYLTYTQSRYRWGKLIDAEPSRFIEEIDEQFIEYLTPITEHRYKPLLDVDIFDEVDRSKLRLRKPISSSAPKGPSESNLRKLRRLKPVTSDAKKNINLKDLNLSEGTIVEHVRFGKGRIMKIEGVGADTKAEINFANGGLKKLLLRFAKLKVIE
jgi:DNA helicase-2/ATP-dependent DNA helicase PcrA